MGRRILFYGFVLIAGYLVLAQFTGFGKDLTAGTTAGDTIIRDLQGR